MFDEGGRRGQEGQGGWGGRLSLGQIEAVVEQLEFWQNPWNFILNFFCGGSVLYTTTIYSIVSGCKTKMVQVYVRVHGAAKICPEILPRPSMGQRSVHKYYLDLAWDKDLSRNST